MPDLADLPNVMSSAFEAPAMTALQPPPVTHRPRIVLLYGSLREGRSAAF
jgi:arsenic resistance protein ArsH